MLNLFVTGVEKNAGKTFITAGLAATMQGLGYSTCVYKPVQTGSIEKNGFAQSSDLVFVKTIDPYLKTYSTYLLKSQAVPILAAEEEGVVIDKQLIKKEFEVLQKENDCTIVNSSGEISSPLGTNFLVSDMVKMLDLPLLIVASPGENLINNTLLSINNAVEKGIKVRGVIINDYPEYTNNSDLKSAPRLIEEYSDAKILGVIPHFSDTKLDPSDLITNILNGIDIESVFDVKIAKLDVE